MLETALEHLVKGIVDNPDDVTVDMVSGKTVSIAVALFVVVAVIWLVPDRRIERVIGPVE